MPKLKFADDLPQRASVNAPLQCQICFESPAETTAKAPPEEPSLFDECGDTNERNPQAVPQQQAHCPPAKTALSDHGRQRYSLEKKREALELFNRGYGYKRASIVLGVPAYTVRDWNRLYKENRFLQSRQHPGHEIALGRNCR
jgi:hypothetical protein